MSNPNLHAAENDTEQSIEERLARLRADAEDLSDEAEDLPSELRNTLYDIEDRLTELYDVVTAQASRSADAVEAMIETRPWISVAVAFSAGCLATILLTPRPRKRNWYGW